MIRRISTKWVLAVLLAVVVPFVGFAWFVNVKVSGRLAGDVVDYYLLSMASDLAERLDEELDERRGDAELLAGVQLVGWLVEDLIDSTTNPEAAAFESTVQVLFDRMVLRRDAYAYILALTPDGRSVMTNSVYTDGTRLPDSLKEYWSSRDFSQEAWFARALEEGSVLIDFHHLDLTGVLDAAGEPLEGGWYLGIASRIERVPMRPEAAGVLVTLLSWERIQQSLDRYGERRLSLGEEDSMGEDIYDSSYAWLWRSDVDTIIAHPDRSLYGQRVTQIHDGTLRQMSEGVAGRSRGMYPDYEFRGVGKKAAFAQCRTEDVGGLGWIVGVGVDDADIYAPVTELTNWLFSTSAVILALAVLFSFWIAHRTTQPIRDLQQHTRRVGQGDLDARIEVRSNDELGQLAASFNRMTQELKETQSQLVKVEKETAWREMARQVAHEIKNPLTPISLSAGLLHRSWREKSPEFEKILDRTIAMIQRQVENMREVARDFYAFAGEHKDPRPVPLGLLLEHVLDLNAAWAEEREVLLQVPAAEGIFVQADPDELQRALLNLVANAIDAMPDGGELRITVSQEPEGVVVEIRDTGTGIDPEVAARLFEPYFTTRSAGTGLGLAIVRRVIEDLGGEVMLVNAKDGPGAIARLVLPSSPDTDDSSPR